MQYSASIYLYIGYLIKNQDFSLRRDYEKLIIVFVSITSVIKILKTNTAIIGLLPAFFLWNLIIIGNNVTAVTAIDFTNIPLFSLIVNIASYVLYSLGIRDLTTISVSCLTMIELVMKPVFVFLILRETPELFVLVFVTIIIMTLFSGSVDLHKHRAKKMEVFHE